MEDLSVSLQGLDKSFSAFAALPRHGEKELTPRSELLESLTRQKDLGDDRLSVKYAVQVAVMQPLCEVQGQATYAGPETDDQTEGGDDRFHRGIAERNR